MSLGSLSFASPAFLWALLAVPALLAAYLLAQRRRARYAVRFTNVELLATLIPRSAAWRRHVPPALALLSLAALLAGFARPQALIPVPKDQATIVMVMDTSGSMAASDVEPTRMAAARQAGKSFVDILPANFKISVVAFASSARTLVRPTTDRAVVRAALDALQAEGGTAMGDAIARGVEIAEEVRAEPTPNPTPPPATATPATTPLPGATTAPIVAATPISTPEKPPAAILLLSDGANTDGRTSPFEAARMARAAGIPVYTIALGTADGVLEVPLAPGLPGLPGLGGGRGRVPVRRIEVPPDERTLRQVAEITGGQFFSAPSASDLRAVYRDIGSRIGFEYERQEVTFAFAAVGAALLVAAGALSLAWFQRVL
jgi:Ca-activated chloride channel homolog